ncbi:2'-5' RNA ligase superfamily protein [Sphingomonas guangdongensis]|uniref:2'-5' RNA ligase superfamily protein n=1 Tax=Sphingomonas guangdongensis TaxID=1141890 RepID=A0A285R185_9SPHN|nr:2'-5' RNA ligase family protein [Sphingomonas guangdongensis]SOB87594.1 2'-5' RNA ligase superfamily protein [Sphingomonas guangdongensis]
MTPAPIIVSALFGAEDAAWLNAARRAHFPPERNVLDAHLTLFHHLPPDVGAELKRRLSELTRNQPPPRAWIGSLRNLGRGVAYGVESPELEAIRAELADAFAPLLTPQDRAGWRPHVTIQNKVEPAAARALLAELSAGFTRRPLSIAGLAAWWYRGGPWEPLSRHMFA